MMYWRIKYAEDIRLEYRGELLYRSSDGLLHPATRSCAICTIRFHNFHIPIAADENDIDVYKRGCE